MRCLLRRTALVLTAAAAAVGSGSPPRPGRPVYFWSGNDVDAKANPTKLPYLMEPIIASLTAGMAALGVTPTTNVVPMAGVDGTGPRPPPLHFWDAIAPGSVFFWVGWFGKDVVPWAALRAKGVYTIYYQTEPVAQTSQSNCINTTRRSDVAKIMRGVPPCTERCGLTRNEVDEIWDWSWQNIDACARDQRAPRQRYVPPGALPGRPQIMQKGPLDAKFTFFGFIGLGRKGCWRYLRQTSPLLASKLEKVYTIWSDEAYAKYVESSSSAGVYLNLHKHEATREARNKKGVYLSSSCGGSQSGPVPSVRNAKLLNSNGLIVSVRSYPKDEAEFNGIVRFVSGSQLAREFEALLNMTLEARQADANERASLFRAKFSPRAILERAGVDVLFSNLSATTWPRGS